MDPTTTLDPLAAALADGLHQHRMQKAQDDAADALGRTVIDALRAAIAPLLPRMLALPSREDVCDIRRHQWNDDKTLSCDELALKLLASKDSGLVLTLRLCHQRELTLRVPTVASRRYQKAPPHILLEEAAGDRNYPPRSNPAEYTFALATPPSQVIAQFCAMLALHVDYARVQP